MTEQLQQPQQDIFETALQGVEETKQKEQKIEKKSRMKKIVISLFAVVLLVGTCAGVYWYYQDQKVKTAQLAQAKLDKYRVDVALASVSILQSAAGAEDICNQYSKVWSDSINARYGLVVNGKRAYDFNEALRYKKDEIKSKISDLTSKSAGIEAQMKSINQPPTEYQKAYDVLLQTYSMVTEYVSQAESPTGSLITFNQKIGQLSGDISKKFNEFKVLIPDLESVAKQKL